MGIDALIQWIRDIWWKFWPLFQVEQFNLGVRLRGGKAREVLTPGLHWRIPFLDTKLEETVVPTTADLSPQTLVTKDGKTITVKAMIKSRVVDVCKYLIEVSDTKDAMGDTTMGIIARIIMDNTWIDVMKSDINNEITKKARAAAKQFGIEIIQVTLTDIAPTPSFRLYTGSHSEFAG